MGAFRLLLQADPVRAVRELAAVRSGPESSVELPAEGTCGEAAALGLAGLRPHTAQPHVFRRSREGSIDLWSWEHQSGDCLTHGFECIVCGHRWGDWIWPMMEAGELVNDCSGGRT